MSGPDGMPAILLKRLANCLVRPITIIFASQRQAAAARGSNCTGRGRSVHNVADDEATADPYPNDDHVYNIRNNESVPPLTATINTQ